MGYIEEEQYINELIRKQIDETADIEINVIDKTCIEYMQAIKYAD